MVSARTGHGDPERSVELLWGGPQAARRRGPRPRLDVAAIASGAVALADEDGLEALTMRRLATRLGLASPNALYTYVPSKAELVDLMVDRCYRAFALDPGPVDATSTERLRRIADANLALHVAHPWLSDVTTDRPPLGPGQLRKYELELRALEGHGLDDRAMDLVLGLLLTWVRGHAASAVGATRTEDEAAWWASAGPALAARVEPDDFPLAARIGAAAGEAQGRAADPDVAYRFGIARLAAGVDALLAEGR